MTTARTDPVRPDRATGPRRRPSPGRQNWSSWPAYDAAVKGFRGYWYPVAWSTNLREGKPLAVTVCGDKVALMRDGGKVYGLHDRCPHRGVPLSAGSREFPGTLSCAYHGWTFDLASGRLCAVITDGPDSPICGKVTVATYPVEERLGLLWVYVGDGELPRPLDQHIPEELLDRSFSLGGRIQVRRGNWRLACENGFDEGHAKFLHRKALWRVARAMPAWNITHLTDRSRWIYRVQDEVHWEADFPGYGRWSSLRWWKIRPSAKATQSISNTGNGRAPHPVIAAQEFPGFASVTVPGILRIVYPTFIHYEFYVPIDASTHRYVGLMVSFDDTFGGRLFHLKYLGAIRWLFHGLFSAQDAWMVEQTDAPPERLYRPDSSIIGWRRMCEQAAAARGDGQAQDGRRAR